MGDSKEKLLLLEVAICDFQKNAVMLNLFQHLRYGVLKLVGVCIFFGIVERTEVVIEEVLKQVQDDSWQCASVTFIDDRFLIIDDTEMYHIGASLKDLGKKWFAFSKFDKGVVGVLGKIS